MYDLREVNDVGFVWGVDSSRDMFHLNEDTLGKILQVPREEIQTVVGNSLSKEFV